MARTVLFATILLISCSSSHSSVDCGAAELVVDGGHSYCVASSALVIEGGFECPPELPFRTELPDGIVCGDEPRGRRDLPLALCRRLGGDCGEEDAGSPDGRTPDASDGGVCAGSDEDGDGIPDLLEGNEDLDGDGLLNRNDTDSDNDGILDSEEAFVEGLGCPMLANCDGDDAPDFRDLDSDNDGLSDRDEVRTGFDRCAPDTGGDGCLDSAVAVFGGCVDVTILRIQPVIGPEEQDRVTLTVPSVAGMSDRVSLSLVPVPGEFGMPVPSEFLSGFVAVGAMPAGAATPSGADFSAVRADASLEFDLGLQVPEQRSDTAYVAWMVLRDQDGTEIHRRGLLVLIEQFVLLI